MVWLWEAGTAEGVTCDERRARQIAESFLSAGRADTALVEGAVFVCDLKSLSDSYYRPSSGRWSARRGQDGRITWKLLPASPERAAS
jgi:hypothetical protein